MRSEPASAPLADAFQLVVDHKPGHNAHHRTLSFGAIFAICVVVFVSTKIFIGVLLYRKWTRTKQVCEVQVSGGKLVMFQGSSHGKAASPNSKTVMKKAEALTKKDIIGAGGYGTVYKLVLDDNSAYAVKKLARGGFDNDRGFERELETLSDIKHRNLVTLRGYYSSPQVNLLVYDLMTNGSLDDHLHDRKDGAEPLPWALRLNIALGCARGLAYLHHDCVPHIIHRDIKASNILLDGDMEAHVGDFGLAKLKCPQQTHVSTIIAGTLGYLAPEYIDTGKVTEKGDVYSYGVVLLELITGKRPTNEIFQEYNVGIVEWVTEAYESGHATDCFDEELLDSASDELTEATGLACQCLNPNPKLRPTMVQVVKTLERLQAKYDKGYTYSMPVDHLSIPFKYTEPLLEDTLRFGAKFDDKYIFKRSSDISTEASCSRGSTAELFRSSTDTRSSSSFSPNRSDSDSFV